MMLDWVKKLFKGDVLWEETDQKYPQYSVRVVRKKPYVGELRVMHNRRVFHKENVNISYNAEYGVDVFDLYSWATTATSASDRHMESLNAGE